MNASGKFVGPRVSYASMTASAADKDVKGTYIKKTVIPAPPTPPAPTPPAEYGAAVTGSRMDNIRELFGRLWWLWLVVIVMWLAKGE